MEEENKPKKTFLRFGDGLVDVNDIKRIEKQDAINIDKNAEEFKIKILTNDLPERLERPNEIEEVFYERDERERRFEEVENKVSVIGIIL